MIELRLLVDEVDYEDLIRFLAPLLADKMKEKGGLAALLGGRKEALTAMALQKIKSMGQAERDELLLRLIAEKSDMLVDKLNRTAAKESVGIHVSSLTARKLDA